MNASVLIRSCCVHAFEVCLRLSAYVFAGVSTIECVQYICGGISTIECVFRWRCLQLSAYFRGDVSMIKCLCQWRCVYNRVNISMEMCLRLNAYICGSVLQMSLCVIGGMSTTEYVCRGVSTIELVCQWRRVNVWVRIRRLSVLLNWIFSD